MTGPVPVEVTVKVAVEPSHFVTAAGCEVIARFVLTVRVTTLLSAAGLQEPDAVILYLKLLNPGGIFSMLNVFVLAPV